MIGQNDRQTQILSGQLVILAGHCPVTGRYFEPREGTGGKQTEMTEDVFFTPESNNNSVKYSKEKGLYSTGLTLHSRLL